MKGRLQKDVRCFAEFVRHKHDGILSRDVAETFGVAYAAGALAIRSNLLPWRERDLLDAIGKVFYAAKALLPDEGVALRNGLKSLRSLLKDIRHTARLGVDEIDFAKARGICESKKSQRRYLVKNEAFGAIFATPQEKLLFSIGCGRKGGSPLLDRVKHHEKIERRASSSSGPTGRGVGRMKFVSRAKLFSGGRTKAKHDAVARSNHESRRSSTARSSKAKHATSPRCGRRDLISGRLNDFVWASARVGSG